MLIYNEIYTSNMYYMQALYANGREDLNDN